MAPRATGIIGAAAAAVIAYPLALPAVVMLGIIAVRQGIGTAVALAVVIVAFGIGARIALPRLTRAALRAQRRWANFVFRGWTLWQQKRMLTASEHRIRSTVTAESNPATDLGRNGGELGAS